MFLSEQCTLQQIEEWKVQKLEALNTQLNKISESQKALHKSLIECDKMSQDENENNIQQIVAETLNIHRIFDPKQPQQYVLDNTQIMKISFDAKTSIANLSKHGQMQLSNDPQINFPEIILKEPMKREFESVEQMNGYKVCLHFETIIIPKMDNLTIGYKEIMNNGDDEKGMNEQWKSAKYGQIKTNDDGKHSVDIENFLDFDATYKYFVGLKVKEPIKMRIASNIAQIKIKKPMFWQKIDWIQTQKSLENIFNIGKLKKKLESEGSIFH